jgi:uncharacterized protein (DUF433 family)
MQTFDGLGLMYIDATPALEAQVAQHVQIYPAEIDGHPQVTGYRVIAKEVAAALRAGSGQ